MLAKIYNMIKVTLSVQAPTFLDLAGWPVPDDMDGMSLKPLLMGEKEDDVRIQLLSLACLVLVWPVLLVAPISFLL